MVDGDVVERCQMKDRKQVWSEVAPFKRGLHRNSTDTQPPIFHSHETQIHIQNQLSRVSPTFPHPTLHMIHINTGILESAAVV
jgi:hypothetical protein